MLYVQFALSDLHVPDWLTNWTNEQIVQILFNLSIGTNKLDKLYKLYKLLKWAWTNCTNCTIWSFRGQNGQIGMIPKFVVQILGNPPGRRGGVTKFA